MSITYTKLMSSITESTVWMEPNPTRIAWIAMLAMADRKGRVWGSVPGLANRARISVEEARAAIATFMAPDPDSRTKEHDGRRIEEIDGGWRLLNYEKHRDARDADERRAYMREYMREKRKQKVNNVSSGKPKLAQAEAEAEAEADPRSKISTDLVLGRGKKTSRAARLALDALPDEWAQFAESRGLAGSAMAETWETFRDYWQAQPGQKGVKADWAATWRNWVRRETQNRGNHDGARNHGGRQSLVERIDAANPIRPDPSKGHMF